MRYLPLAWSGLALAISVLAPLMAIWGDVASALSAYGLSFDSLAMLLHELGLLIGLAITLCFLSKRGIGLSDLGLGTGIRTSWIAYAIGGFLIAIFLYPAIETFARAIETLIHAVVREAHGTCRADFGVARGRLQEAQGAGRGRGGER